MKAKTTFRSLLFVLAGFIYTATIKGQNDQITIVRTDEKGQTETTIEPFSKDSKIDLDRVLSESENGHLEIKICPKTGGEAEQIFLFKRAANAGGTTKMIICDGKMAEKTPVGDERGFLGVEENDGAEASEGLAVTVQKGGAAEKAGLQTGDAILFLDDQKIGGWADLTAFMRSTKAEQTVKISFSRAGKIEKTEAVLAKKPEPRPFAWHGGHETWSRKTSRGDGQNWPKKEACLGVFGHSAADDKGAQIESLVTDGAAGPAGLEAGDVITAIDGVPITTYNQLYRTVGEYEPGAKVKIEFLRGAEKGSKMVVLKACDPRSRIQKRETIVIQNPTQSVDNQRVTPSSKLELEAFSVFPNPSSDLVTVRFSGPSEPTVVQLLDAAGRELFREEMNVFSGQYEQQFDLSRAARGPVVVSVRQGEKGHTEQLILN